MKTNKYILGLFLSVLVNFTAKAQSADEPTGLPGDNFDLQGALQLFQNAASPEDFEKALNTESNHVNNLDLDGDGEIDYVRVVEKEDKNAHILVLQVPVSANENQDIAVIEIEKTGAESAIIQIIGDEDIYGEETIVEPAGGEGENAFLNSSENNNRRGPSVNLDDDVAGIIVNVWLWPSVRFIYAPAYRPWISPWRWHGYPAYWKPWKPLGWKVWHPYRVPYHRSFVIVRTHRVSYAHNFYKPYRSSSVIIRNKHSAAVNNYRVTRTRTTVTGPRGNSSTIRKTTVTGPKGRKATKVKVRKHH